MLALFCLLTGSALSYPLGLVIFKMTVNWKFVRVFSVYLFNLRFYGLRFTIMIIVWILDIAYFDSYSRSALYLEGLEKKS